MAALTGLAALLTLTSCFQLSPPKDCQLMCLPNVDCPGGLQCQPPPPGMNYGFCASPGAPMCPPLLSGTDAGSGGPDADAGAPMPPTMLCHHDACFTLPDSLRQNLVLLLWPSNLPAVGSPVSVWRDQSGNGNDAHALNPGGLPQVTADGVHLDASQAGTGFVVLNSQSLDFGSGDFAVTVVAGLSSATTPLSLLKKSDGERTNSRQISIDWVLSTALSGRPQGAIDDTPIVANTDIPQPSVGTYTLYRSADHVELHLNGTALGNADLPTGLSTTNPDDLYLGVNGTVGRPADSIEAVIAVRGSVDSTTLRNLELFLYNAYGK